MKFMLAPVIPLLAIALAVSPRLAMAAENQPQAQANKEQQQSKPAAQQNNKPAAQQAQQPQAQQDVEKQRKEAEQQAQQTLDKDAVAAIDETKKALDAIAANKPDEALATVEQATGKINILLARNPATALIPVAAEVDIIDAAPQDVHAIKDRAWAAARAINAKDYPTARVLLDGLASELRVRTYNLPLATYPAALQEAARLLDQKKNQEATTVLQTALNTLVAVDRVSPLPLIVAQTAIEEAQSLRDQDKNRAQQLLTQARHELERAKELGYTGNDPEYAALDKSITELETQLQGTTDTASVFSKLKERMTAFFKRQSESQRS